MEGLALVSVDYLMRKGGELKADKNGKLSVILTPIAGNLPSNRVLSGTIAERLKLEVGKLAFVQFTESEANEYGRQFTFQNFGTPSMLEIVGLKKELGAPNVISVTTTAEAEDAFKTIVDETVKEEAAA